MEQCHSAAAGSENTSGILTLSLCISLRPPTAGPRTRSFASFAMEARRSAYGPAEAKSIDIKCLID